MNLKKALTKNTSEDNPMPQIPCERQRLSSQNSLLLMKNISTVVSYKNENYAVPHPVVNADSKPSMKNVAAQFETTIGLS